MYHTLLLDNENELISIKETKYVEFSEIIKPTLQEVKPMSKTQRV